MSTNRVDRITLDIGQLIRDAFGTTLQHSIPSVNHETNLQVRGQKATVLKILNEYLTETQQELHIDYVLRPTPEAPGTGDGP
jgi:hypothetical protein